MICGGSFIQSTYMSGFHYNFEALVYVPADGVLQHYYRENYTPEKTWVKGQQVGPPDEGPHEIIGPAALIQPDLSPFGVQGNFEVIAQEKDGLAHYWRNNSANQNWHRTGVFAPGVTEAGALVLDPLNGLQVVARLGRRLYHYSRGEKDQVWLRTERPISEGADGVPAMIYSSYGNLELIVQEGEQLVHYWRNHRTLRWKREAVVAARVTGAPGFVQGPFGDGRKQEFRSRRAGRRPDRILLAR